MAELYSRQWCTYCQEEVVGLRVRCAECTDMDICLPCFSAGAEIGSHRNDHAYYIIDSGTVGIFQGKGSWSAKEEVRLLDAIEQFGFGNWEDISKYIETRTSEEAKDEYISRYLEGSIGRATWGGVEAPIRPAPSCSIQDDGPLCPDAVARLPPLAISAEEAAQLGYMSNRDDFEREHDNEAEQIISSLSLNYEDDDLDIALKLSQVDIYTRRLRERTRRKRLVRDYQLVSIFFNNLKNRGKPITKLTKERKDFIDKLRPFTRFSSRTEHNVITASLWRERELRVRLSELVRYRRNGITSAEECAHFERHAAANMGTSNNHPVNARAAAFARMAGSSGCTMQQNHSQQDLSPTHQSSQKRRESESASSSISPKSIRDGSTVCGCCRRRSCCSNNTINNCCNANVHLLTSNEVELCNSLNLPPLQYITMKTVLLKGNGDKIHSQSSTPDSLFLKNEIGECTSSTIEAVITKYLQANGWINAS